jgi:hypothetical protein
MSAISEDEFEEESSSSDLFEINHEYHDYEGSLFSFDFQKWNDSVFVAVGKAESRSSMDALVWTLRYLVTPSTVVHLIHVFPPIRYIPSPCKLSVSLSFSMCLSTKLRSFIVEVLPN